MTEAASRKVVRLTTVVPCCCRLAAFGLPARLVVPPPDLPAADPDATAHYVRAVLAGDAPMPEPIAAQVDHLVALHRQVVASAATGAVCA